MTESQTVAQLELWRENEDLRRRLEEAEEALRALRAGEVDAVLVEAEREQVYTLEAADEPYRLLVEQLPQSAATLTVGGTILYSNRRFTELLKSPLPALLGKPIHDLVAPESRPVIASLLREGQVAEVQGEVTLLRADGTPVPVYLGVCALAEGALGRCLMVTDLTEQRHYQELRRTQEALRASEARFRDLLLALPVAVYTTDREGRITLFNDQAAHLWDRRPEIDKDLWCGSWRIFRPDGSPLPHDCCPMAATLREGHAVRSEEIVVERPDGTRICVLAHPEPLRDASGEVVGAVNMLVDITDRKQMEEALKDADRRKDEFLATLAHELRNPLAPIRNALQLFKAKDLPDPELQWGRDVIDRQVQVMARLLEDLLDVSRISRGKVELRKERVTLRSIIEAALETSRPVIEAGSHQLTMILPPEPIYLEADPVRLAQVFSNLLNNAAKYTEQNGHIWLSVARQGSTVRVSVKDSGIGIPSEMLPHIFAIFSQAAPALPHAQGGLGIGLSLVKGLVELHGGGIEAHSGGPGRGSEFVVYLPVAEASPVQEPAPPTQDGEQDVGAPCRILVVDDNRDSADTLAMLLQIMGNEVGTAYDGEQAITAAAALRPDVVLLDIGMPKLDGYAAGRRIREQPWGKEMVLIALTGWGQEDDRRRTEEAGFNGHMVKPVDPAELMKLLASLSRRGAGRPARR